MAIDQNTEYAGQRSQATARQSAHRSRRRGHGLPAINLVPAVIAAGAVLLIGSVSAPPRYEARSAFVVDWKSLPSTLGDENAERARNEWRNAVIGRVTGLPRSAEEMIALLNQAGNSGSGQTDNAAVFEKLRKSLRVNLVEQTDNYDRFVVQLRDRSPDLAQAEANRVLRGIVSKLKAESQVDSRTALLHSNANTVIQAGLVSLSSPDRALLGGSIKVEETRVEKRYAGYIWGVWFAAVCLGSLAGRAGRLMRPFALIIAELNAATTRIQKVKRPKAPAVNRLPVIRPRPDFQPAPLSPLWLSATQPNQSSVHLSPMTR
jgi:hypothetical protein